MIDLEPLLRPISDAEPAGRYLKRDPLYDEIQEARRQDDDAARGDWERKLKKSDWPAVRKLCTDALTNRTKDLQIAAWLTESLIYLQGWQGLAAGVTLLRELNTRFWDTVFPPLDEEENNSAELRAKPINWLVAQLDRAVRHIRITHDGLNWHDYYQSRQVGYEADANTSDKEEFRAQAIADKKLTAEAFDKSFDKSGWAFHKAQLDAIDAVLAEIAALEQVCAARYGAAIPSFRPARDAIGNMQTLIESLSMKMRPADEPDPEPEPQLEPEREPEPEPVESKPEPSRVRSAGGGTAVAPARAVSTSVVDDESAVAAVGEAARFLRREHPGSPAPYLMLRGLRWGELRDALRSGAMLPAPATEVRQRLKALYSSGDWQDLLEGAEEALAGVTGRAWLDLQRYAVKACEELGGEYNDVAQTVRASLNALIAEFPDLPRTELADGTNAANADTLEWLREIRPEPPRPAAIQPRESEDEPELLDAWDIALETAASGRRDEAVRILSVAIREAGSGRSRFERRLQLAEFCLRTDLPAVARPVLEDLVAESEARRLAEWEDASAACRPLRLLHDCLTQLDADTQRRAQLVAAICRIDPAGALDLCE
jgi:type VI secretion system protein ImpA